MGRGQAVLMSSAWPHWTTPEDQIIEPLRQFGGIGLDPCSCPASKTGARVELYGPGQFSASRYRVRESLGAGIDGHPIELQRAEDGLPITDGLAASWASPLGLTFFNPPYGQPISHWTGKAHREALDGAEIVGLVPARVDTGWFFNHIWGDLPEKPAADAIIFIRGRLVHGNPPCDICRPQSKDDPTGRMVAEHEHAVMMVTEAAPVLAYGRGKARGVHEFEAMSNGATFPSCIPYYGARTDEFIETFRHLGRPVRLKHGRRGYAAMRAA